jgi:hypothetical protein
VHLVDKVVFEGLLFLSICLRRSVFLLVNLSVTVQEILTMVVGQVQRLFLLGRVVVLLLGLERSVESDVWVVYARVLLLDGIEGSKDFVVQIGGGQFGGIVFLLIARRLFVRVFVLVLFLDCMVLVSER